MLSPGTTAPDFELFSDPKEKMNLKQWKGKRVVLVFYPADWSPVCGDQLALYNEVNDYFRKLNAQVIGISVDGKWCHASYREQRNLDFPLLADFEPKGKISKAYGVYNEQDGQSERALFVLDENGVIQWSYLSDRGVNPGADGIISALEKWNKKKQPNRFVMPLAVPVSKHDHTWGNPDAAIEVVEYGDFQCPHCGRAYPLVKELKYTFKDSMKFVFRHFPLTRVHPQAMAAAVAAEAAGRQNKFWEMHDMLFDNQAYLSIESLISYAESIGLDTAQFTNDLQDSNLHDKVEKDFMGGMRSGVNGTPTFFINGERYEGSWEGDNLARYIEEQFGVKP